MNDFNKRGIKALLLDVDGTLISRRDKILRDDIKSWLINTSKQIEIHLVSNNPSFSRIKKIAEQVNLPFTYRASKPNKYKVLNIIEDLPYKPNQIAIIGDRLFTDVLVGNRLNLYTIFICKIRRDKTRNSLSKMQLIEVNLAKLLGGYSI